MRKRFFSKVLGIGIACTAFFTACAQEEQDTQEEKEIELSEANFPDAGFREYLSDYVDLDGNKSLSPEERAAVTVIANTGNMFGEAVSCTEKEEKQMEAISAIRSFTGIQYFPNLQEIQLNAEAQAEILKLEHPKLERVAVETPALKEFALTQTENLTRFIYSSFGEEEIAWEDMHNLQYLKTDGVALDLSILLQNHQLNYVHLDDCAITTETACPDFGELQQLEHINIYLPSTQQEVICEQLDFTKNTSLKWVAISRKLTKEVALGSTQTECNMSGTGEDFEVIYCVDTSEFIPTDLKEGEIPLSEEYFPDIFFRNYLKLYVDTDYNLVLTQEEREKLVCIRNGKYNYDKDKEWNATYQNQIDWWEQEEFDCASRIKDLRGVEYFPNLLEIQLNGVRLEEGLTEIVITNPKLEIFSLQYYGNLTRIDLTACEKLRHCEVRNGSQDKTKIAELDVSGLKNLQSLNKTDNVVLKKEVALLTPTPIPTPVLADEGDMYLNADNFPDESFREYLSRCADNDQNGVLSREEREALLGIGSGYYGEESYAEEPKRWELLQDVVDYEGIQYFENLEEIYLPGGHNIKSLSLNHPKLKEAKIEGGKVQKLVIRNAEGLEKVKLEGVQSADIDWVSMHNLQEIELDAEKSFTADMHVMTQLSYIDMSNVTFDFSWLAQNSKLRAVYLSNCESLTKLETLDLSGLQWLHKFRILGNKIPNETWFESIRFGTSFWLGSEGYNITLKEGVTKKVYLANKGAQVRIDGDASSCEIVYEDELPENRTELAEGSIWNVEENIADFRLRCYLHDSVDSNHDSILTAEERAGFVVLDDDFYDYRLPVDENAELEWRVEDDRPWYVTGLTSLKGLEYFPELVQVQLETLKLSEDVREIVINNPKLEILDLRFNGNVETIDLTACENLRICVIDSTRDEEFVQETAPVILLPEHLEFQTMEGMDCVIGEAAITRCNSEKTY